MKPKHIVFIQHGDYMETVKSFAIGGKETYAAQKYSVDYVENLPAKYEKVSVICIDLEPEYYEVLPSGVHSYGLRIYTRNGHKKLLALLADIDPTHIVLRSPNLPVLCWAINRKVDIFPNLADSFSVRGLVSWYKVRKLKKALNNSHIKFVSNHNVIASKNLVDIGVNPDKIIPWDWPSAYSPDNFPIREKPYDDSHIKLLYVGSLIISKGVGDYIDAISLLTKSLNVRFTLNIVGTGSDTILLKEK
jgi:glycosyltransferase involved in cell wall biosynthesis